MNKTATASATVGADAAGSPAGATGEYGAPHQGWRRQIYRVVFESDTPAGVLFDKVLVVAIVASILTVMIDSVPSIHAHWGGVLEVAEWGFTALFTLEYLLRIICLRQPMKYARSFYGIVDMLAVLPTYLVLFFPNIHVLIDVRVIRLLRIFRIFKLTPYVREFQALSGAVAASARKIQVFLAVVLMIVIIMGSVMYVVEGPQHGFTSIPTAIYWAITTMTTVGFGDIAPKTEVGRMISSVMMLIGWGTLAVPTGIVTSELAFRRRYGEPCEACGADSHDPAARFCSRCGAPFPPAPF